VDVALLDAGRATAAGQEPIETSNSFSGSENGAWGSTEDYMLAQFERMESHIEDLRRKVLEMDASQSLLRLQANSRITEQLSELANKVGVLNMHTTWLMNMQRQSHAQQRSGGSHNPGMSRSPDSGGTRSSPENPAPHRAGSRRNSDGRGENPPRL
jgi:hypothetical protein